MTVHLVTRRADHLLKDNLITVVRPEEYNLHTHLLSSSTRRCTRRCTNTTECDWHVLGHDIETRFELPEISEDGLLLSAFCNKDEEVLVIDNTSVSNDEVFDEETLSRCLFIAHSADFEARWGATRGFLPGRYGCTLTNGKRLMSGMTGFRHDLISEIKRWLGPDEVPIWMEKDIRNDFAHITVFEDKHILYNASDTIKLIKLYYAQLEQAEALGQAFLHRTINSRIIIPIAKAEVTGIRHDSDRWKIITEERKLKAEKICQELDALVTGTYGLDIRTVNPQLLKQEISKQNNLIKKQKRLEKLQATLNRLRDQKKTHLKSYVVSLDQVAKLEGSLQGADLPSDPVGVNWGSSQQVVKVLRTIGCPVPEAKDQKTRKPKAGVGKEARANWFVNYATSPYLQVMDLFDTFKKIEHNIKAFGEKWLAQYVRNGRAYTLLDQSGTDTGRFSSGDKKPPGALKQYGNFQQIPKRQGKEYRECFLADPGRVLITADYKNCEGVIMISLSKDLEMKKITELPDQHSYLGTLAWRAAYAKRYERTGDEMDLSLSRHYVMNQSTPEKEEERTKFKNSGGLFPVAYGVTANKVAASAGITEAEGQAMIDAIKAQIPNVITTLDSKSKEASNFGYVIHNERTGSRRWFTPVLDHVHYRFPLTKSQIIEAEMAARNSPIQGTNSDIMKEAIATIDLWTKLFKQDLRFMLTVHDEGVWDCPADKAEFFLTKIEELMKRAAKNYLIKEIDMEVDAHFGAHWGA